VGAFIKWGVLVCAALRLTVPLPLLRVWLTLHCEMLGLGLAAPGALGTPCAQRFRLQRSRPVAACVQLLLWCCWTCHWVR